MADTFNIGVNSEESLRKIEQLRRTDERMKSYMKEVAEKENRPSDINLESGDLVLIKQEKKNKLSTPYKPIPIPYKVVEKKGSMITAENGQHRITRNKSFFKKITKECGGNGTLLNSHTDTRDKTLSKQDSNNLDLRRSSRSTRTPVHFKDYNFI